ncbi:MAG TPA: hypothetical protein VHE32_11305 [Rhodanobacteraceae bacterium]|nr:hypothetical protein [Rhodanobacteraceae bacterium]
MNKSAARVLGAAMACLLSGCAVNLPFNTRLSYQTVLDAQHLSAKSEGPIAIRWVPESFPQRIDTQGASGFVGGGSRTRIPTGVALSGRILEGLDSAVGVLESSKKTLTITIVKAETKFQYSAGFFNVTPAIDEGECTLEASFGIGDKSWTETFHYQLTDPRVGGTSQTAILEKVWDNIAFQVVQNVVEHIKDGAAAG